jgi:hypothetical protein
MAASIASRCRPDRPSGYAKNGTAIQIDGAACDDLKKGTARGAGIFYGCPF